MAVSLPEVSEAFAAAADRASRSTVLVDARSRFPATGIAWAPGVVVTANHVVERDDDIRVGLPSGEDVAATIAGRDTGSDIAVLRVPGDTVEPLTRAVDAPRVGHLVLALGRPAHGGHMASFGAVSTVGGPWRTIRGLTVQGYIRADITMFPGFSGGPLVDASGGVLGLNSSALGRTGGLTIPLDALDPIVRAILEQGHVRRGYLGLSTQVVRLSAAIAGQASHPHETGLLVSAIEPGSPADAGGILIGDILIAFESSSIASTDDLQAQLGPGRVGTTATLRVIRGGQLASLSVTVGERG